ncbi:MAG: class II aldolase/adducin family protein [Phreatobacter sp.]
MSVSEAAPILPDDLGELAAFSARIGRERTLIQGAGGNTSIKIAERLWVKVSGAWLADATDKTIFAPIELGELRAEVEATRATGAELDAGALLSGSSLRPSIETIIHGILPGRVVIHVHSVNTIAHAVRTDAQTILADKLSGLDWRWVPYSRPGRRLGALIEQDIRPSVFVLANHGLVVQADSVQAGAALLEEVERRLSLAPRQGPAPDQAGLTELAAATGMSCPQDPRVHAAALDSVALEHCRHGALYPDHIVYLGASPLPIAEPAETIERIGRQRQQTGQLPDFMVVRGRGILIGPAANRCVAPMLDCFGMVLARLDDPTAVNFLSLDDEAALLSWDQEIHRMRMARS